MITVRRYNYKDLNIWNDFVARAKNGLFLFNRNYMDYHKNRFKDHSLLLFENDKLIALLPANELGKSLQSHAGLTFGGILSTIQMTTEKMLEVFGAMNMYAKKQKFRSILYKAVPHIYHQVPAEEDLYALFCNHARLIERDMASVIIMNKQLRFSKGMKNSLTNARKAKLEVKESNKYDEFMEIVKEILAKKYYAVPTHSAKEIKLLARTFPENIRLFTASQRNKLLAGTIIYQNPTVAHTQYMAVTDEGKPLGALSAVINHCLTYSYKNKLYFSFGRSTKKGGLYLNEGLIFNKEAYGARGVVHDTYEIKI